VILADTERGARWILTVKGNQPRLRQPTRRLPWRAIPNITPQQQSEHGLSGVITVGRAFLRRAAAALSTIEPAGPPERGL
jgi:hypothetical protein